MNIAETIDNVVQFIIQLIEKGKVYVERIIEFFTELKEKIEAFLEYVEDKIQHVQDIINELKCHEEAAA